MDKTGSTLKRDLNKKMATAKIRIARVKNPNGKPEKKSKIIDAAVTYDKSAVLSLPISKNKITKTGKIKSGQCIKAGKVRSSKKIIVEDIKKNCVLDILIEVTYNHSIVIFQLKHKKE